MQQPTNFLHQPPQFYGQPHPLTNQSQSQAIPGYGNPLYNVQPSSNILVPQLQTVLVPMISMISMTPTSQTTNMNLMQSHQQISSLGTNNPYQHLVYNPQGTVPLIQHQPYNPVILQQPFIFVAPPINVPIVAPIERDMAKQSVSLPQSSKGGYIVDSSKIQQSPGILIHPPSDLKSANQHQMNSAYDAEGMIKKTQKEEQAFASWESHSNKQGCNKNLIHALVPHSTQMPLKNIDYTHQLIGSPQESPVEVNRIRKSQVDSNYKQSHMNSQIQSFDLKERDPQNSNQIYQFLSRSLADNKCQTQASSCDGADGLGNQERDQEKNQMQQVDCSHANANYLHALNGNNASFTCCRQAQKQHLNNRLGLIQSLETQQTNRNVDEINGRANNNGSSQQHLSCQQNFERLHQSQVLMNLQSTVIPQSLLGNIQSSKNQVNFIFQTNMGRSNLNGEDVKLPSILNPKRNHSDKALPKYEQIAQMQELHNLEEGASGSQNLEMQSDDESHFIRNSFMGSSADEPRVGTSKEGSQGVLNRNSPYEVLSISQEQQGSSQRCGRPQLMKFKLKQLKNVNLRYEVIFKNLLRDFRKFYTTSFNEMTEYIRKQRYQPPHFFYQCLLRYIVSIGLLKLDKDFAQQIPTEEEQKLVFTLGSLLYPKHMLKILNPQLNQKKDRGSILLHEIKERSMIQRAPKAIVKVHNYLYRFSLERLKFFQNDEPVMKLFKYYYENHAQTRIEESSIMIKYKDAYFEAAEMILKQNPKSDQSKKPQNFQNQQSLPLMINNNQIPNNVASYEQI